MDNSKRGKKKKGFDVRFCIFIFLAILYVIYLIYNYHQGQQNQQNDNNENSLVIFEDETQAEDELFTQTVSDNPMYVNMIDCGQGDAFLFECNGLYGVIDCGPKDHAEEVVDYLKEKNVSTLEFVVGTHPHDDHMGGMYAVLDNFDTKVVYIPKVEDGKIKTKWYSNLMYLIEQKNIKVEYPKQGDEFYLDKAKFRVVGQLNSEEAGSDLNNISTVIKVSFGEMDILMTGDAEKRVENFILKSNENIDCEVLKLGHHGSDSSTSSEFLYAVNPEYAVFSCEVGNKYEHPCTTTMEKLKESSITVYRTDECESVVLTVWDDNISFDKSAGDYDDGVTLGKKRGYNYD